jgi:hypothetical protein
MGGGIDAVAREVFVVDVRVVRTRCLVQSADGTTRYPYAWLSPSRPLSLRIPCVLFYPLIQFFLLFF